MIERLRTMWRVGREFMRIGLVRKSQFRLEFVNQVVMDVLFYAGHILTFEILYGYTQDIAGWSLDDMRVFLGFFFVSDAFMMVWLGQVWLMRDDLKNGNMDSVRVRPGPPTFLYLFQRFSPEGATNLAIALGYLIFGLAGHGLLSSPLTIVLLPWALALGALGQTAIVIGGSSLEFRFLGSDLFRLVFRVLDAPSGNPLDVFGRRLRMFFLFAVPVGLVAFVPAQLVLRRIELPYALLYTAFSVFGFTLVVRLWNRSFRAYESAMG